MSKILTILAILLLTTPVFAGNPQVATKTTEGYLSVSALPAPNSHANVTTATDTDLCQTGCYFLRVVVGVADAGTTVAFYDDADGTCSSGLIATVDSSAVASLAFGLKTTNGLCMKTVGHDTGNVTAVYK